MSLGEHVGGSTDVYAVQNVWYTEDEARGRPVIHLALRTPDGTREHVEVVGHLPSFLVAEDEYDPAITDDPRVVATEECSEVPRAPSENSSEPLARSDEEHEALDGTSLVRIATTLPEHVGDLRDRFEDTWEADVLYPHRFLIDLGIDTGVRIGDSQSPRLIDNLAIFEDVSAGRGAEHGDRRVHATALEPAEPEELSPKVVYTDIEVDVPDDGGFPSVQHAQQPVTAITARASNQDSARTWVLAASEWDEAARLRVEDIGGGSQEPPKDGLDESGSGTSDEVSVFSDESDLLHDFNTWVAEHEPDVLSGWNCVPEGTPVQMADGSEKNIENIEVGDSVIGKDGENVTTTEVRQFAQTGEKKTVTIETQFGEDLTVSKDHPVLVAGESEPHYVEAGDVSEGQYLLTPKSHPSGSGGPDPSRAYQLGLIASDGSLSPEDGVVFYNTETALHDAFETNNALSDANGTQKQRVFTDVDKHTAVERCTDIGLPIRDKQNNSWDLREVYSWGDEPTAAFVAGFTDGDGHVSGGNIGISTENDSARYWIRRLCQQLGVWSTEISGITVGVGRGSIDRFKETVGKWMRHPKKVSRLNELSSSTAGRVSTVPPYMDGGGGVGTDERRIVNDKKRRGINIKRWELEPLDGDSQELSEFIFDRVVAVEESGSETCYDIETGTHNFVANERVVHNCNGFDYPYLVNRCREKGVWSYYDWSPTEDVYTTRYNSPVVKGVSTFDLLDGYKKTQIHDLKEYTLDHVASTELDYGKEDLDLGYGQAWRDAPVQFVEYNRRDVDALIGIEASQEIFDLYANLRDLTGAFWTDCHTNIDMLDVLFLRRARDSDVCLPTATPVDPEDRWYYGAKVFDSVAGLHEHVVYPDLSSLYPNMFLTVNASPETYVGTAEDVRASNHDFGDCVNSYIDTRPVKIVDSGEPYKPYTDGEYKAVRREKDDGSVQTVWYDEPEYTEVYFLRPEVQEGFVRGTVRELMELKEDYRGTEKYEAVKRVTNSCFTPDTEVLTPNGVVNITDVAVGDEVYSYNPETGEMEYKEVVETIQMPEYDGDLVGVQNDSMDFKVTPDHRFLVNRSRHSSEWEYCDAGDLNEYTHYETPNEWEMEHGSGVDTIDLLEYHDDAVEAEGGVVYDKPNHQPVPREYNGDNVVRLLAWVVTEGSFYDGTSKTVTISQETHHRRVGELLEDMGLPHYRGDDHYSIHNTLWYDVLSSWCGVGSENKRLPEWVFEDLSETQKRLLRDTLMDGDGDQRGGTSRRYSTQSTELRDDFIRLCWELGDPCNYNRDSGVWRCQWRTEQTNMSFRMHRDGYEDTAEDGVYCVQVADNHTLVAGRNGKFANIPNCYGVFGDSNSYGTGFRLFHNPIGEAITLGGRKVITYTAEEFVEECGNDTKLIGGDTDSCMSTLPHASNRKSAVSEARAAAEHVNGTYDDFAEREFGAEDHGFEVELESYARRCLIPEPKSGTTKKRYATLIEWEDGEWLEEPSLNIKGFEAIRSDVADITVEVQTFVLRTVLEDGAGTDVRERVYSEIRDYISDLEHGEIPLAEVGISKGMSKAPEEYGSESQTPLPTYRGAKWADDQLPWENITEGAKPVLLYVDSIGGGYSEVYDADTAEDGREVDAIAVEEPERVPDSISVDYERMVDKTLKRPLENIFRAVQWSWEDAIAEDGRMQTGIEDFM